MIPVIGAARILRSLSKKRTALGLICVAIVSFPSGLVRIKDMIYQDVNISRFFEAFADAGQSHKFSNEGKTALFGYLDYLSDTTGKDVFLDIPSLCKNWTEFSDWEDWKKEEGEKLPYVKNVEDLMTHTQVIFTKAEGDTTFPFLVKDF